MCKDQNQGESESEGSQYLTCTAIRRGARRRLSGSGSGARGRGSRHWFESVCVYLDSDTEGGGQRSGQGGPGQLLGGGQGCAVAAAGAAGEAVELLRVGAHQPAARRLMGWGKRCVSGE